MKRSYKPSKREQQIMKRALKTAFIPGREAKRGGTRSPFAVLIATVLVGALGLGGTAVGDFIQNAAENTLSGPAPVEQKDPSSDIPSTSMPSTGTFTLANVPEYAGDPYVYINATHEYPQGAPSFTQTELDRAGKGAFESYTPLDSMGRVGSALACLGPETMPTEERGSISNVHPTGWRQNFYDFVSQEALYNRCHLIAWSLSAENANPQNLMTGTRSMNTKGMLPFEEDTLSYIRNTGNHVLYKATPIFEGQNMLANGIHLQAYSLEDNGAGISFNIYAYNVEDGVKIDYATGNNWEA